MNEQSFQEHLAKHHISLNGKQLEQFALYFELLVVWNQKVNLTAITDRNDVYLKHFYDSITPGFHYDFAHVLTLCDVGAGAGFPSLPLKICFPHLHITIIDSLKKRIAFLEALIEKLGLDHIELVHGRAEDAGRNKSYRESFDVVTARAVANMNVLAEYCLPLCKVDGMFIALKGASAEEELKQAKNAIQLLGGKVDRVETFSLPLEESERGLIFIKKEKKTPKKYPRKAGTPSKQPLS
ncbi:MAG: 16S rRNA (guanine(527)-N(7))-methyltransferase RsmG [Bacilli bacterium]|nr:16S rRNA (guanine(527)-N(7))-methyltransferase RsmG [Bacilli bacterium]